MSQARYTAAALAALFALQGAPAASEARAEQAPIDRQLAGQIDFRDPALNICFGRMVCDLGALSVAAERRVGDAGAWAPAELYWDPIDGFGVLGGGQDDEIDVDERLVVRFGAEVSVKGIWFTDLFVREHARYAAQADLGGAAGPADDREEATVTLSSGGAVTTQLRVHGDFALPEQSFNAAVGPDTFERGGDIRRRLVIAEDEVLVMARAGGEQVSIGQFPLGEIDPAKRALFPPEDGLGIEVTRGLLADYTLDLKLDFLDVSDRNAPRLAALLDDNGYLVALHAAAEVERVLGDISNGEIAARLAAPAAAREMVFTALVGTSNDYSVGGIILDEGPGSR